MKEYEKCEVCGKPIKTADPNLRTFQVCSEQCLDEIAALIMPRTANPDVDDTYREDEKCE